MKSPFPGMDPYLELHWRDVHAALIVYIRDHLQGQLGGKLRARVEERLVVEADEAAVHAINPDARVFESVRGVTAGGGVAIAVPRTAEPLIIPIPDEQLTETNIEIVERGTHDRLITVIELLSPTNKLGKAARAAYDLKRHEIRSGGVNLVEIDLTRAGTRQLSAWPIPRSHRTTFQACVTRSYGVARPQFEVYAMPLQQPLPAIKVPLRPTDRDVTIDLQPLVEQAYRNGAYDDIDYTRPPVPPLSRTDAVWAAELLSNRPA
jgi:hypothetical protein